MGASDFTHVGTGKTAEEALRKLVDAAREEYGNRPYTGTIAEKGGYGITMIRDTPKQVATLYRKATTEEQRGEYMNKQLALLDSATSITKEVAFAMAGMLIDMADPRVDDKHGPTGCIELTAIPGAKEKTFVLFGWASS